MKKQHFFQYHLVLVSVSISPFVFCATSQNVCEMNSCQAWQKAKELGHAQPSRELKKGGEFEGLDYWEQNESLFAEAWSEFPRLHPELYEYNDVFQDTFINPKLRTAIQKLKTSISSHHKSVDESTIWKLITESNVSDVYFVGKSDETDFGLFTKEFCRLLLEELDHLSNSGIPMRRPNGMNRYGAILGKLLNKTRFMIKHKEVNI